MSRERRGPGKRVRVIPHFRHATTFSRMAAAQRVALTARGWTIAQMFRLDVRVPVRTKAGAHA